MTAGDGDIHDAQRQRIQDDIELKSRTVVAVGPGPFTNWIVTISGSMRFYPQMLTVADELSRQLYIVLMPFVRHESGPFGYIPHPGAMPVAKEALDELHHEKLRLSELLAVVSDRTGYFGESTAREIEWAKSYGISVMYATVSEEGIEWDNAPRQN